jgi:ketosteroid isomerase-like protein
MEHIFWSARLVVLERQRVWVNMSNIAELETKLNDAILAGKAMEAFEELYDDDVVMQENMEPEFRGKDFNRKREQEFFASVEAWHSGRVLGSAVNGDLSFSEWEMEISIKGVGRVQLAQVAVRRWKNGKIVHERFYHK